MMTPKKLASGCTTSLAYPARLVTVTCWLGVAILAICLGLLASESYAPLLIAIFLICGILVWVPPRPAAVPVIMLGVVLLPTPAIVAARVHGIPLATSLGVVTVFAALALWWHRRTRGATAALSSYSVASLLILVTVSIAQLGISHYAELRPVYQLPMFWLSGLLLGSLLASDLRIADRVGLLALPLAMLAIVESVLGKPNLWSNLLSATAFNSISSQGGIVRPDSTFGHPLVAGTALIIMAFLLLIQPGRGRAILFSLIVAGAVVTVSRSALVGLAAGLLTHLLGRQSRQRSQMVGAMAVTVAISWFMISVVPALHTAFESRVFGNDVATASARLANNESIRLNSLQTLEANLSQADSELFIGRGLEGSMNYLAQTGGNLGFAVYDNQYVASFYDSGLVAVLAVIGLVILGVIRARPSARRLAPLVAAAAAMFFFEGLYWPVTGLLFWMTVGLATSRPSLKTRDVSNASPPK